MLKILITSFLLFLNIFSFAQILISGEIIDETSKQPIEGASITLLPNNITVISDANGKFNFKNILFKEHKTLQINTIGYSSKNVSVEDLKKSKIILLVQKQVQLQDINIVSNTNGDHYKIISKTDIAMRGVNNSQEVLRIIPGIVIGQHQGGGKAEQIFLRGFDADHGTDFRLDVDGMPINMSSHAHGQGFADSHFIIPETIESVNFKKGPYAANKGDFNTTGSVDFITKNSLLNNQVKLEAGMFNTYRALGMFNLLNKKNKDKQQSWYVTSEYRYSDAYFVHPQNFNRFNLFTKFNGKISNKSSLIISATTFWSAWKASGQIPDRAVAKGIIGFYGALDPNEGGVVYRTNANAQIITSLNNGDVLKNQVYYSNAHFDLHTNFTFFLKDTINGDEIRQQEARDLFGYNGSYVHNRDAGNVKIATEAGLNIRTDLTSNSALSHTKNRYTLLNRIKLGDISQWDIAPYISKTFTFSKRFSLNAGLRYDQFYFKYNNKLAEDTTLPGIGIYKGKANTFSPKLNIYYHLNDHTQFYLTSGKGFHSNDARAVVLENSKHILPSAYGSDLGVIFKPFPKIIVNAALWYIYLQQEFTYNGDGGDANFNDKTIRKGFDVTLRYQPKTTLYFDLDINYAHGRVVGQPEGQNFIPLAPVWTSTGGVTYTTKNGFNGSFRYRFVGDRPGNQNYSLTTEGYFVTDAVLNYTKPNYEIGLVVNNVFNTKWKETQFETLTRLKNEAIPVNQNCFTPGTPFGFKFSVAYFF